MKMRNSGSRSRICIKDILMKLSFDFSKREIGIFTKHIRWRLLECLNWRIENEIDQILSKPIVPIELYRAVRDSQLIGLSGYSKEGIPVFAVGVGLSTFDKASVHYYVQSHIQVNEYRDRVVLPAASKKHGCYVGACLKVLDMTGLKISALSQIKLLTIISTVDDLNYPEKTDIYFIVNAPYIFSACWKVVKPLLQERTRKKIKLLQGSGQEELLKVMDSSSLPHFCRKDGSGSARHASTGTGNCYSLDHPFHQKLYSYIRGEAQRARPAQLVKEGSFHVDVPLLELDQSEIAHTIECELHKLEDQKLNKRMNGLTILRD
ncbi:SEC14 cytosolic factor-like isoform X2 [Wolffia australiana]